MLSSEQWRALKERRLPKAEVPALPDFHLPDVLSYRKPAIALAVLVAVAYQLGSGWSRERAVIPIQAGSKSPHAATLVAKPHVQEPSDRDERLAKWISELDRAPHGATPSLWKELLRGE